MNRPAVLALAVVLLVVFPVACSSTPSHLTPETDEPTPADRPTQMKVISAEGERDPSGYLVITGSVQNTGTEAVGDIAIRLEAYDASDAVVDSRLGTTDDAVVLPGGTSTFQIQLQDPDGKMERFEVEIVDYREQQP
jgi:hypothetical protein